MTSVFNIFLQYESILLIYYFTVNASSSIYYLERVIQAYRLLCRSTLLLTFYIFNIYIYTYNDK